MYTSNFTKLVQMLQETQKNWVVHIETEEIGSGKPWQAQLSFVGGIVATGHVWQKRDGRVLFTNGEAIRWLTSLPQFSWTLSALTLPEVVSPALRDTQAGLSSPSRVPRRALQAEQQVISPWSRRQRQVFALVDGTRSAERIALILRQPPQVVEETLNELQAMDVITRE